MRVVIIRVEKGVETVVGVRNARDGRALFACVGSGPSGAVLALREAMAYCKRRGHEVATQTVVEAA